jgi:hypothetical protein
LGRGAPKGNRNAWKHGRDSAESLELRVYARKLIREINMILDKPSRRSRPKLQRPSLPANCGLSGGLSGETQNTPG